MNQTPQRLYEFDSFRLDVYERVLLRQGQVISVTPKVFETLLVLVENRGRIMSKEELMQRLWPDSFVEEANLTQNISVIRRALGENFSTPRFIETVPKRGYRFIAEVRSLEPSPSLIVQEHSVTTVTIDTGTGSALAESTAVPLYRFLPERMSAWARNNPRVAVSSTMAVTAAIIGLVFWTIARPALPSEWRGELRARQLFGMKSLQGGMLSDSRFSPNGQMIAYSIMENDAAHIWIRQTNGSRENQVTQDVSHDTSPIWSPDGTRIAYISDRDQRFGIWAVKFLGGTPELLKVLDKKPGVTNGAPHVLVAWSKDSSAIYYELDGNLYRLELATHETKQLTKFDSQFAAKEFTLSYDERQAAFIAQQNGQGDIWRVVLDGGARFQITNDPAEERIPLWEGGGKWLFYNLIREGRTQINVVEAEGGEVTVLQVNGPQDYLADVSADGHQLLCYGERHESDLFAVDVESKPASERQLTDYLGAEFWPTISPDGQQMVFHFLSGEQFEWDPRKSLLRLISLTGQSFPSELATQALAPQWSPDGRWVAFLRRTKSLYQLYMLRSVGGEERGIVEGGVVFTGYTFGPAFNAFRAPDFTWAPDSKQIAYCSKTNDISEVSIVEVETGRQRIISGYDNSKRDKFGPLWSPDGQRLAWVGEEIDSASDKWLRSVWTVNLNESSLQPELIFQTNLNLKLVGWISNSELLMATVGGDELNRARRASINLFRYSIVDRSSRFIRELPKSYFSNLRLSPDKRNVSFVSAPDDRDNIQILSLADGNIWQITNNSDSKVFISSLDWSPVDSKTIYFGKQVRRSVLSIVSK